MDKRKPGEYIREELSKRKWSQRELAHIIGRPYQMVNELIQGKRAILPDMAIALATAFRTSPDIWMQREYEYQLAKASTDSAPIKRRCKLFELAPIKEMERRQWIRPTNKVDELEAELCKFFEINSIDDTPTIGAATRKSDNGNELTSSQCAWCFRVKQIAKSKSVAKYDENIIKSCFSSLRKIAAYPQEIYKVPNVLESIGIRFVIVEPLQSCKVDGVAIWLDDSSPVIGMSCRYDRIDSFWFTLCHELSHIRHRDESPLDSDLSNKSIDSIMTIKSVMERRANEEAADMLIPKEELESFIKRIGPLYSKDAIIQFAHRMKIHPGIIVGQLQNREEIGYKANREMLSKVKKYITSFATTDGWGNSIKLN